MVRGINDWLDEHRLLPGDNIHASIDRGVRLWDKTLLLCSESSLRSWWVNNEVTTELEKEQRLLTERGSETLALIPLNLDGFLFSSDSTYPQQTQLTKRYVPDFEGWATDNLKFEEGFEKVVKALRSGDDAREQPPEPRL